MARSNLSLIMVGSIFVLALALPAAAQPNARHSEGTRDNERADVNRQRSVQRSQRALQPEVPLYNYPQESGIDFYSLSQQINNLGTIIRQLGDAAAIATRSMRHVGGVMPYVHPGNFRQLYGPQGPTARSVKALLEHRLVVAGNPRLQAGRIISNAETVTAEVVTVKEGALVEKFTIDKATGIWKREF